MMQKKNEFFLLYTYSKKYEIGFVKTKSLIMEVASEKRFSESTKGFELE